MLHLLSLFVFTPPTCQVCFDVFARWPPILPLHSLSNTHTLFCPSVGVMSELCRSLTSRPSGDDMPDDSLNQYLPVSPCCFVFDSAPSRPTPQALCISSPTCCDGTPLFRRCRGSSGRPRPAGWTSPSLNFPRPASRRHQLGTRRRVQRSEKKARM